MFPVCNEGIKLKILDKPLSRSYLLQQWLYNIRGYYDRGKFVVNLGCFADMVIINWSVRSSSWRGGDEVKGVDREDRYSSQL